MKVLLLAALLLTDIAIEKRYSARVEGVHDGDTITLSIDLGLEVSRREVVRLIGLDAPELNTAAGKTVRDTLTRLLEGKDIVLVTRGDKREKYGRLLGTVWLGTTNVNEWLIGRGLAKSYDGGKR